MPQGPGLVIPPDLAVSGVPSHDCSIVLKGFGPETVAPLKRPILILMCAASICGCRSSATPLSDPFARIAFRDYIASGMGGPSTDPGDYHVVVSRQGSLIQVEIWPRQLDLNRFGAGSTGASTKTTIDPKTRRIVRRTVGV